MCTSVPGVLVTNNKVLNLFLFYKIMMYTGFCLVGTVNKRRTFLYYTRYQLHLSTESVKNT